MEPFRGAAGGCAKCGALNPDTYAPNGDLVCRGCAGTMEANARMGVGRDTTKVGAVVGIAVGIMLLVGAVGLIVAAELTKFNARIVGLLIGLGIVSIVASVRNLKSLKGAP